MNSREGSQEDDQQDVEWLIAEINDELSYL